MVYSWFQSVPAPVLIKTVKNCEGGEARGSLGRGRATAEGPLNGRRSYGVERRFLERSRGSLVSSADLVRVACLAALISTAQRAETGERLPGSSEPLPVVFQEASDFVA